MAVAATLERVEAIATDTSATVAERSQRIAELFAHQGAQGPGLAAECLLRTADEAVAEYVAVYLELTPGAREAKTRAAERLRRAGPLVRSAARLVPWLPESLLNAFVDDYLAAPDPSCC